MPESNVFREQALRHHHQLESGCGVVRVSPTWTWALLLALAGLLGTALAASIIGRVEVTGRGPGILRPRSGVRVVTAMVDGTVAQVEAHSGQQLRAGTVLARIEAPPVQAQHLEARRQAEAVRSQYRTTAALQDRAQAEQARRLDARMARLTELLASQRNSVQLLERNLERNLALERDGIQSPARSDEAREALAHARRQLSQSEEALEHARQDAAVLADQRQERLWQRRQTIDSAEGRVAATAFLLGQTLVRAPTDGAVEAMLVKPGDALRAGQILCKLIPQGSALETVAFLAERDRAFVRPGDPVHLELEQLPYAEYGTLRARIERISDDLASPYEIQEALGEHLRVTGPCFRVVLALTDDGATRRAGIPLRSGMLVQARFTLRRQRLITLVLDPLRRWFR
jgi:multidrug resistance efflux pump